MKIAALFVICFVVAGFGTYSYVTTLPPPLVVYATADGDFENVGIYSRGERKDYLEAEIYGDGETIWFDNSFSDHRVFKVFIMINGTTYGPREINLVTGTEVSIEEAGVTVTIVEDMAPQGFVGADTWLLIILVTILGGIGLWVLSLMIDSWIYSATYERRKRMKERYGYEMRLPWPNARKKKRMPIEGRWWIRMINVKLGREEKAVIE